MEEHTVREISDTEALAFLRAHTTSADRKDIFIRSHDVWIGSFEDGKLVSVAGMDEKGFYLSIGSMFTLPEYRRRGHGGAALSALMGPFGGRAVRAYFRPASVHLAERQGLQAVRTLRNGTVYMKRGEIDI